MTEIPSSYEEFRERVTELMKIKMDKLSGLLKLIDTMGISHLQPNEIEDMILSPDTDLRRSVLLNAYVWFGDYMEDGSKLMKMSLDKENYNFYKNTDTDQLVAYLKNQPKKKNGDKVRLYI